MAKKLPKFITEDEINRMLERINDKCFTGIRNKAILTIMFRSGLRVSEVTNLAPADLDFKSGLIYVQRGKGDKDRYTVMDDKLIDICQKWNDIRPDCEYFFCTYKSGQVDTRYIREMCYRVSGKAGVFIQDGREKKPVNPHALRHGFATRALNELDMNIREVQEMLGHSNISTTQVYTHVSPVNLAKKYRERSVSG